MFTGVEKCTSLHKARSCALVYARAVERVLHEDAVALESLFIMIPYTTALTLCSKICFVMLLFWRSNMKRMSKYNVTLTNQVTLSFIWSYAFFSDIRITMTVCTQLFRNSTVCNDRWNVWLQTYELCITYPTCSPTFAASCAQQGVRFWLNCGQECCCPNSTDHWPISHGPLLGRLIAANSEPTAAATSW